MMRKILLYGDVDLNIIDGSAIWLLSMAESLAKTNSKITLLLKKNVTRDNFLDKISTFSNIDVIEPFPGISPNEGELLPRLAAQRLAEIDSELNADVVICRGYKICAHVSSSPTLGSKSWLYMTDIPHPASMIGEKQLTQLRETIVRAKRIFAQTQGARSYIEALIPEACGKTLILNPMVPDEYYQVPVLQYGRTIRKIVYSGKFAKNWRTLEMCDLPRAMTVSGTQLIMTMIGDKFQIDPHDNEWSTRMATAIHNNGIEWTGGLPRDSAAAVVAEHDISLSWRSPIMDDSLEISTKVLESSAMGVPPLINRNAAHEVLFGVDYPLFLERDSLEEVVRVLSCLGPVTNTLRNHVREAVANYSISASANRLEAYFSNAEADYVSVRRKEGRKRVVIAGHDFKFAGELVDILSKREDIELKFDHWPNLHTHDVSLSEELIKWADTVICEWAGPNAVWYSRNKRMDQKLIVRLHMFELRGPWLSRIDVSAIDTLVCVSKLYEQRVRATKGWDEVNICVIPNAVDGLDFFRPKFEDSRFRIGLVGIVPIRKRLDRAVDLMRGLLERDSRYTLHVRGRMPWEYDYEWKKPTQQLAYRQIFSEIGASSELLNSIVFEPFGADMGSWMRKIGFILSPSSDESFHLAPAEGMASGSVPIFWPRPGVEDIFGHRWKVDGTDNAVDYIDRLSKDSDRWALESDAAREYSLRFEVSTVAKTWLEEIL